MSVFFENCSYECLICAGLHCQVESPIVAAHRVIRIVMCSGEPKKNRNLIRTKMGNVSTSHHPTYDARKGYSPTCRNAPMCSHQRQRSLIVFDFEVAPACREFETRCKFCFRWRLQDRTRLVFQNILYLHLHDQPVPTADTDCECRLEKGCCEAAFSSWVCWCLFCFSECWSLLLSIIYLSECYEKQCKKQTAVWYRSTEVDVVPLDIGSRMEGLFAWKLRDIVFDVVRIFCWSVTGWPFASSQIQNITNCKWINWLRSTSSTRVQYPCSCV